MYTSRALRCSRTLGLGLLVLCVLLALVGQARPGRAAGSVLPPPAGGLSAWLNPDGTLNLQCGRGSFDAHGYTLRPGPDRLRPAGSASCPARQF